MLSTNSSNLFNPMVLFSAFQILPCSWDTFILLLLVVLVLLSSLFRFRFRVVLSVWRVGLESLLGNVLVDEVEVEIDL